MKILLAILGTYRIAHMLVAEEGPFLIFEKWRAWALDRFSRERWLYNGVTCVLCISFWLALPVAWLMRRGDKEKRPFLLDWWGTAGGALFVHRLFYE